MHNIHYIESICSQNALLKCNVKGVPKIQITKLQINTKTCVMCNPWKKTFTLVPLTLLTMFSSFSFLV